MLLGHGKSSMLKDVDQSQGSTSKADSEGMGCRMIGWFSQNVGLTYHIVLVCWAGRLRIMSFGAPHCFWTLLGFRSSD
jgi:hypothetical protein